MTAFHIVLEQAGSQVARKVYHRLHLIAHHDERGRAMLHNLYEETNFEKSDWEQLIGALSAADPDPIAIEDTVRRFCRTARKDSRPWGPEARPTTRFLGRIIPFKTLLNIFLEQPGGKVLPRELAHLALRGIIDVSPSALASVMRSLPLGSFVMWSTFDIRGTGAPFDRPLPPLASLLARLGLDAGEANESHLVLEYRLPEDHEPIEMLCSVSEYMLYNEQMKFGNPTAGTGGQRPPKQ